MQRAHISIIDHREARRIRMMIFVHDISTRQEAISFRHGPCVLRECVPSILRAMAVKPPWLNKPPARCPIAAIYRGDREKKSSENGDHFRRGRPIRTPMYSLSVA